MARLSVAAAENVLAGLDGRLDPALVVNAAVLGGGGWGGVVWGGGGGGGGRCTD